MKLSINGYGDELKLHLEEALHAVSQRLQPLNFHLRRRMKKEFLKMYKILGIPNRGLVEDMKLRVDQLEKKITRIPLTLSSGSRKI